MNDDDGDGVWTHVQYFSAGDYHDYKFTIDGWNAQEDLTGLTDCAVETDGYWNRNFTAGDANTSQTLTYCYGTCNETCETANPCGDGTCADDEDCSSCPTDCGACPEHSVVFDISGVEDCGFVSVTGTFDSWSGWGAHTDSAFTASMAAGDYEFVILCVLQTTIDSGVEWWNDIWANSTQYSAPIGGSCWNGNDIYANYTLSVSSDMTVSYCAGTCDATCAPTCGAGDLNGDDSLDVLDIVAIVSIIVNNGDYDECADYNGDGSVDVLDIVAMVSSIVSGRSADATSAVMSIDGSTLNISGNGFIGAVQITLSHGSDFSISLTDDAMVADYATSDNMTTLIVVAPGSEEIFTATGDYDVAEVIVANSSTYVDVIEPGSFTLDAAYPNPFNPSTSLSLNMPVEGYVSVKAYNLVGQVVGVIAEGSMDAGIHTMTWNASSLSSGVYLITAEYAGSISTQKVMLMK
jgi:hypothetical protein